MAKEDSKKKTPILKEIFEFLVKFEATPQQSKQTTETDIWNEIRVPAFRNFKVFMHNSETKLIIVIPTHVSNKTDVHYHVISESMLVDSHNGEYEMISQEEFWAKYKCNFINNMQEQFSQTAKITDLAELLIDALPEIKKLKRKTIADRKNSVNYLSRMILDFLMLRVPKSKD